MHRHASLNRAFRLVFNRSLGTWAVAPETAKGQGRAGGAVGGGASAPVGTTAFAPRRLRLAILAGLGLFALPSLAMALDPGALPSGGTVKAGQVQIGVDGNRMVIDQQSNRAIIDWQGFDIGQDAAVRFNQPGADAATLNRVLGGKRSEIMGQLSANGQVYLVNGAGVLFGNTAQVNVGGLVASTLNISNQDFLAGQDRFTLIDNSTGEVINQGSITAKNGTVALLGKTVRNEGRIDASGGNAILAAGQEITFAAGANGHLNIAMDASELQLAVHNGGAIVADGGQVVLNAQGANALAAAVVSNTGTLQARTVAEREGKILLLADLDSGGTAKVAGSLDASAPTQGHGGFVETSAANVQITADTRVTTKAAQGKTGTWLIDPTDFTVSAGNATQSTSGIGADTLNASLQTTSVTLQTAEDGSETGDIHVKAAVTWSADTILTLNAHRNINIDAAITATGQHAGLVLNHGGYGHSGTTAPDSDYHVRAPVTLSGANASLAINGNAYTLIHSMAQLDGIDDTGLGGRYALARDLDASGTTYDRALVGVDDSKAFTGTFAGLGHTLSNLTIDSANAYVGLFGYTGESAAIRDLGLTNVNTTGNNAAGSNNIVGALVGENLATISNVYATGSVTGIGVGLNPSNYLGGLVGANSGTISNAYGSVTVTGMGLNNYNYLGGLVGVNYGTISNAYATGNVTGTGTNNSLGGLAGTNEGQHGTVSNAYATGSVTGTGTNNYLGGLVGYSSSSNSTISDAYATGSVTGTGTYNDLGGLVGFNLSTISNAHWDSGSTGQAQAVGSGTNATNTTDIANNRYAHTAYSHFGTWSEAIPGVLVARDANGTPQWVMLEGSTRPFLYSEYSTTVRNAHQLQLMALDLGAHYTLADDIDASATNGQNTSGMWSTAGFVPVGDNRTDSDDSRFTGSLGGQGHTISGLTVAVASPSYSSDAYAGLFGQTGSAARIEGLTLRDIDISATGGAYNYAGGLVGVNGGTISDVSVSGKVRAVAPQPEPWPGPMESNVGGIAGSNTGILSHVRAQIEVAALGSRNNRAGGLVGLDSSRTATASISDSQATGKVTASAADGASFAGGLVGHAGRGGILRSSAVTEVEASGGTTWAGGLVGLKNGDITGSHASGSVLAIGTYTSGMVGNWAGGLFGDSYSGSVTASGYRLAGDARIEARGSDSVVNLIGGVVRADGIQGKTLTLKSAGTLDLPDAILLADNTLSLDAGAAFTPGGAVVVGTFILQNGNWQQLNASLPDFAANDFRLQGGSFLRALRGDGTAASPWQLTDVYGLQGVQGFLGNHFALANNIDARGTANWNCTAGACAGFDPLGNGGTAFSGEFDGNAHRIEGLTIKRPTEDYVGLFGNVAQGASIRRLGVTGVDILGYKNVGGLAGYNAGTLTQVYGSGEVGGSRTTTMSEAIGGLVGFNGGSLSDAYADTRVDGDYYSGGLVGSNSGEVTNAYATGNVTGSTGVGGLVAYNDGGRIENAYATGMVTGGSAGGLVGLSTGSVSSSFYATTDAVGNVINNGGGANGMFGGNTIGGARTWLELVDPTTFAGWDAQRWTFAGAGASVAGYGVVLPYLIQVTRAADIANSTLFQGGSGTAGNPYTLINWQQLAGINLVLGGGYTFQLLSSLGSGTAGYTAYAGATANGGAGWKPLGAIQNGFKGTFDGLSHTLSDLVIDRDNTSHVGLFGLTHASSVIRNAGLLGARVTGSGAVGGMVGSHHGSLDNVYVIGDIAGRDIIGGLVGGNYGRITNAYVSGSVTGSGSSIGGLVGSNSSGGSINDTYASARVKGSRQVGGLVGANFSGTIIANSLYATTDTAGNAINNGGAVNHGFSGNNLGTARTLAQLTQLSTFTDAGWDIDDAGGTGKAWRIYEGHTGPLLRSFLRQVTVTANTLAGKTYDGQAASGTTGYTASGASLEGELTYRTGSKNAGTYQATDGSLILSGLWSGQQGYDISYGDAQLTIDRRAIGGTVTADNRVYDGTTAARFGGTLATRSGNTGLIDGDELSLTASGAFRDKNAGTGKDVDYQNATLGGADAGNYRFTGATQGSTTATIDRRDIGGSVTADNRVYDGTTDASFGGTLATRSGNTGLIDGDELSLTASGAFRDKNAGTGKDVDYQNATLGGADAGNYRFTGATQSTTTADIRKAQANVTANSGRGTYNGVDQQVTGFTASGLVNGETESVLDGITTRGGQGRNAGTYAHTASGSDGNYALTFVDGALAIDKAQLTAIANDDRKLADGQPYAGGNGVRYVGFVAGEDESVLGGTLAFGGTAQGAVAAGEYTIAASGLESGNYELNYRDGHLLIETPPVVPDVPTLASGPDAGTIERQVGREMTGDDPLAALYSIEPDTIEGIQLRASAPLTVADNYIRLEE